MFKLQLTHLLDAARIGSFPFDFVRLDAIHCQHCISGLDSIVNNVHEWRNVDHVFDVPGKSHVWVNSGCVTVLWGNEVHRSDHLANDGAVLVIVGLATICGVKSQNRSNQSTSLCGSTSPVPVRF